MGVIRLVRSHRTSARRNTARRTAATTLAVAALTAGAATAVLAPAGAGAVTGPSCGATIAKPGGGNWQCTFADDFSGTGLDTTKWSPYSSLKGGFVGGDECYSPSNVKVHDGALRLDANKWGTFTCTDGRQSNYLSGLVMSKGKFSQAYGRFEIRARTPAGVGFQPAFWMLPENPWQPGGYTYGEIDVMEAWGQYPGIASPHLHNVAAYDPQSGAFNRQSGAYCHIDNMTSAYHTYAVEWTTSLMMFRYDGNVCWTTRWKPMAGYQPAGATSPSPFNQNFYIILNLAMGGPRTPGNRATASTPFPAEMSVDYVRVWR
jgi:beta-glucanase (GH16 family)